MTKAVQTVTETVPAHLQQLSPDVAGLGNSRDAQDNTLPFLAILQKGSPQINKREPSYIENAEAGMLMNTATHEIFSGDEGVRFIPCGIQKKFVEWVPRSAGGGYVDTHVFDLQLAKKMGATRTPEGQITLPSGNQLVETLYTFGLLPNMQMVVLAATSTALKPMRDWMSLRNTFRINNTPAPAFSRAYQLRTVYQKNDSGDWYNWRVSDLGWVVDADEYAAALEFARMIASGELRMGRPSMELDSVDDSIPV